jgi:hypothetical protein
MGTYFHYVNFTKRQHFIIGALGGGIKFTSIGRNLSARAFELMLTKPGVTLQKLPPIVGAWVGDEVAIIGDDWDSEGEMIRKDFVDIGANVVLMLMESDGFEDLKTAATAHDNFFMQLAYLATTRQSSAIEKEMEIHFGADFRRRYKQMCEEGGSFEPLNIVEFSP